MRGVRLPLPIQTHRVHLTALDQLKKHRPTSHELMAQHNCVSGTSDLTPFGDLAHENNSAAEQ
ncbi:MAG: hypothetical protein HOP32_15365 [Nitrospira sp.]|nr:hypothetical protein [Nitrospira sp.]